MIFEIKFSGRPNTIARGLRELIEYILVPDKSGEPFFEDVNCPGEGNLINDVDHKAGGCWT